VAEDKNGRNHFLLGKKSGAGTVLGLPGTTTVLTHAPPSFPPRGGFPHESVGGGASTTTDSSESETENNSAALEEEGAVTSKILLLTDQLSLDQKRHLTIKDIGVILDRLSSKILDVERLDRESESRDCFNWTIKASIRGEVLRELGVIYNGNYYAISEHPAYYGAGRTTTTTTTAPTTSGSTNTPGSRDLGREDSEEDMRL
jgi:hypothetical protein